MTKSRVLADDVPMFDGFTLTTIDANGVPIRVRHGGRGPGLLLLHGNPQTHVMWHKIAPRLAENFTVVATDLRGYGDSGKPQTAADHAPYSKRAMARDMTIVMEQLGFRHFAVVGHDRGGRVAHRLALDHPSRVQRLAVLDIVPAAEAWDRADARFALAFWPWSLLAQPTPLPERLLTAAPEAIVADALRNWGSPADVFGPKVRAAYVDALCDPAHVHAICEEYRAAATLDRLHDEEDRRAGRRIACPVLALWSGSGGLGTWYVEEGGPLALWQAWADNVQGEPVEAGHFFPEERPEETAAALSRFLAANP
jgi:haloacetate dehalogenase